MTDEERVNAARQLDHAAMSVMWEELQRLRAFAREMFELADWPEGGGIDGFSFQDAAVKHGLLTAETRTERCGEKCYCADDYHGEEAMKDGVTCYRKADWLAEKAEHAVIRRLEKALISD